MNNFSKTKKILIVAIAILLAGIFGLVYYFNLIHQESIKIFDLHQTFYEEYSQNHTASNLEQRLADLTLKEEKISSLFLSEGDIVSFIEQVENFGSSTDVLVKTENVDATGLVDKETNKKKTYAEITITLGATGNWENVNRFEKILENLPYYSSIKSIKYTKSNNNGKISWLAEISLGVMVKTK